MRLSPFEEGDILKPIEGRFTSNSVPLKHLLKVKVTKLRGEYSAGKMYAEVKVIKGNPGSYYGTKGRLLNVYLDSFEHCKESDNPDGDYSLW